MQLSLGGDAGVATLGPQLKLKKNVFQGVVVQVRDATTIPHVLAQVRALPRLRRSEHLPHAFRVRTESPLHPAVLLRSLESESDGDGGVRKINKKMYRPPEDPTVAEDWEDDNEAGVGDRLLHVLQRWQVENVLLVVARQDDSLSGRLIGHELFKLMVETAKLALEQYYVSNIAPSDAAKLEIFEAENGAAQYMITPRVDTDDQQQQQDNQQQLEQSVAPKPRASVCLMTSDTIASWPANHQPTSDGGGRKVAKKGRVNHFNHGRKASVPAASPEKTQRSNSERDAVASLPTPQPSIGPLTTDETDTLLASGGIDWLGITRDEWLKLRMIRVPVKELHYLFMCLVVLVDKPLERQSKAAPTTRQNEQFSAPSYSWNRCRDVLQHTAQWSDQLKGFRGSALTKSQATALRSVLQEPSVNEAAFVRICSASVKLFSWIQCLLDEHDEHELGISSALSPAAGVEPPQLVVHESPAPLLLPQPPPVKPQLVQSQPTRKPTHKSLAFGSTSAEESALVRELNALIHAKKNKIVDRGRLLSQRHLH